MGSRLCSSDSPSENISRYPVPSKKDLPSDIAERMEEVESKVHTKQWRYRAMRCCTVPLPYSECAKTRRFLTGRLFTECLQSPLPQTGRIQSLLLLLWWTYEQRDRCVFVYHQRSCHYVSMLSFVKGFSYGQACGHKCLISQSFNWIKPIIYMHQSSNKLSFLRHTWRNSTGICCCFNSRVVSQHLVWCSPSYQDDVLKMNLFEHWHISFWHSLMQEILLGNFVICKERQQQTVMSS